MEIKQFRYGSDNLAYLVYRNNLGIAIDPGAVDEMHEFITTSGIRITHVVNTHTHPDHTHGNASMLSKTGAAYIDMKTLIKTESLELSDKRIRVHHTPGHSEDSVIFHFDHILVTGDTLFTGKAGRCFTGNLERYLESIKFIMSFPEHTTIYGGHDYVLEYMQTAKSIEPTNEAIDDFLKTYDPKHVRSTLSEEYKINPTLRFNHPDLINILKRKGLPVESEFDRWQSVMSIV